LSVLEHSIDGRRASKNPVPPEGETMAKGPRSHATARRLTKPWEYGNRMLFAYSFKEDKFLEKPSARLLTGERSFGAEAEKFLNEKIEQPLTNHLDSLAAGTFTAQLPWPQERALILSSMFQATRVRAGCGEVDSVAHLQELVGKDDVFLDELAVASRTRFRFYGVKLAARLPPLCFPSAGIAALPVVGARAIMFQPTSLSTFFATIPVDVPEHLVIDHLRQLMDTGVAAACSVGLTCDLVILPPQHRDQIDRNDLRGVLRKFRTCARGLMDAFRQANELTGLI
jgi:hypothetical protein